MTTFGAKGDGSTDDTAAIKTAIGALSPGYELYFPCGTYRVSSQLTIATTNVAIAGAPGCVTLRGTGTGYTLLRVGEGSVSASTPLMAAAAELGTSFSASFGNIGGVTAGDYVVLEEGGKDYSTDTSPGHDANCDVSGCRGEVLEVASVSGSTVTVATALHYPYDPALNAANVSKVVSPLSGIYVHDLTLDGSTTLASGLSMVAVVKSTVANVSAHGFVNSALNTYYGYELAWNNVSVAQAGNGNDDAFNVHVQGRPSMNGVSLANLSANAFGLGIGTEADGTFTNVTIDSSGVSSGRPFKTCAASYNTFSGLTVKNGPSAYNGLSIEYYSSHNTFNDCVVTNNQSCDGCGGAGINQFGNFNQYNTYNNCSVTGNGNVQVSVGKFDALQLGMDAFVTISGGTYSGTDSAEPVIILEGASPYVHGATIGGTGSLGLYLYTSAPNGCINNNTFLAGGLAAGIQVSSTTDGGSGNILNGLSSNLTQGTCP